MVERRTASVELRMSRRASPAICSSTADRKEPLEARETNITARISESPRA
jgi:hypothetical protein